MHQEQKFFDEDDGSTSTSITKQQMFRKFDYDKSGTLDLYQFQQALKMQNHSINITGA